MATSQLVARNMFVLIDFIWQLFVRKLQKYKEFSLNMKILSSTQCCPFSLINREKPSLYLRDFWLPSQYKWGPCSSVMLCNVDWFSVTNVS